MSDTPESYARPETPSTSAAASPAASTGANTSSGEPLRRTLTSTDGRTLEADLLARGRDAVRIRRVSDAQEFTLPLDKLSEPDRTFIRDSELPPIPAR